MLHRPADFKPQVKNKLIPRLSATLTGSAVIISDSLSILLAGLLTYLSIIEHSGDIGLYSAAVSFVWLSAVILMHFAGLYRYDVVIAPVRNLQAVTVAYATACMFLLAAAFSIKISADFSRMWFIVFTATSLVALSASRIALSFFFRRVSTYNAVKRSLAIIGSGKQGAMLVETMENSPNQPLHIFGVFTENSKPVDDESKGKGDVPVSGNLDNLVKHVRAGNVDDVVIALPWSQDNRIAKIIAKLRELPVNVYLGSDLVGYRTQVGAAPSHFGNLPVFHVMGKPISGWDGILKALEDYVFGAIILALISPVLLIIAIAVLIDSGRPFLFKQKRLGFNNDEFEVYKFRTMYNNCDEIGITKQASEDDPRVTRVGRFLRRFSLDELPQIFNVLNGTMSLVGPRPHALDHNEEFSDRIRGYFARHRVKPGITGLAQVNGFRGPTDTDEKLEGRIKNDIFYVENWTLSFDMQILIRTFVVCIFGKNAF